ncbi:MAG TPA: FHA domain-containing protein, partial [Leptolinea sp.]
LINAVPSLNSLTKALEQASSAPLRPGMKQSILYITPLLSAGQAKAMDNIAEQAAGGGIKINIWLIAPASAKQPQAEQAVASLAERTGGQVFRFTGKEALPPIETYLQPLRRQYEIIYRSRTNKSGAQIVALEVQADTVQARSPEENYEIALKAPNVMFVNPMEKVVLAWKQTENGPAELSPAEVPLELHIEFPDNHPRNVIVTDLLVDGQIVDERNATPFTTVRWPVTSLKTSGVYNLQVTIKDELGFSGKTVVLPLNIVVPTPPASNWLDAVSTERLALAVGALLLVIAGIFIFRYQRMKKIKKSSQKPASMRVDSRPLDRPSAVINLSPLQTGSTLDASPQYTTGWLLPLESGDSISTQPSIRLGEDVITLGSSPIRARVVIPSPSVDGLHIRILRQKNGGYWLEDAGSVSGTWVNGTPVSNLGTVLNPGDEIRLGKIKYRFELRG